MKMMLTLSPRIWSRPVGAAAGKMAFTAIEVTAVATIIAILALILIPIVRGRIEEAKITAAQDDLNGLEKALTIAYADCGQYFRLQDLERPLPDLSDPTLTPLEVTYEKAKVPQFYWDSSVPVNQVPNLLENWKGPYISFKNFVTIDELINLHPNFVHGDVGNGGPILVMNTLDDLDWTTRPGYRSRAKYPIDPWGNPYIYFGAGKITDGPGGTVPAIAAANRENYSTGLICSLGPDGLPGDVAAGTVTSADYFRETEKLGMPGFDESNHKLVREF